MILITAQVLAPMTRILLRHDFFFILCVYFLDLFSVDVENYSIQFNLIMWFCVLFKSEKLQVYMYIYHKNNLKFFFNLPTALATD